MKNNLFLKTFTLTLLFIVILAIMVPYECYIQVKAANTKPISLSDKFIIIQGYIWLVFIIIYRILALIFITLPIRRNILREKYMNILKKDFISSILPLLLAFLANTVLIIYIMNGYAPVDITKYLYMTSIGLILIVLTGIYISIYSIPRSIFRGSRKKSLLLGLQVSIPPSLFALFLTILFGYFGDLYIFRCSAGLYGIKVINPNTYIIESLMSVGIFGLLINIIWYLTYSWFLEYIYLKYY